jgi:hypothetical protein
VTSPTLADFEEPPDLTEFEGTVRALCVDRLREMARLRDFRVPPPDANPDEVHDASRELRGRLDAAEVIIKELARSKRRARRMLRAATATYDDVYDAEMARLARAAVRLEYQSVHDRTAMARVTASPQRRAARAAERLADYVEQAEEEARSSYFGLRDIREELLTTLRSYLPWLSSLETT